MMSIYQHYEVAYKEINPTSQSAVDMNIDRTSQFDLFLCNQGIRSVMLFCNSIAFVIPARTY